MEPIMNSVQDENSLHKNQAQKKACKDKVQCKIKAQCRSNPNTPGADPGPGRILGTILGPAGRQGLPKMEHFGTKSLKNQEK